MLDLPLPQLWMIFSALVLFALAAAHCFTKVNQRSELKFYLWVLMLSCIVAMQASLYGVTSFVLQVVCALAVIVVGVLGKPWWQSRNRSRAKTDNSQADSDEAEDESDPRDWLRYVAIETPQTLFLHVVATGVFVFALYLVHLWLNDADFDRTEALIFVSLGILVELGAIFKVLTDPKAQRESLDTFGTQALSAPRTNLQQAPAIPDGCVEVSHWQPDGTASVNYLGGSWIARLTDSQMERTNGVFLITRVQAGTLWVEPTFTPSRRKVL